jgi:hypothetical protein
MHDGVDRARKLRCYLCGRGLVESLALLWTLWRRGKSKHVARFVLVALYTGRRASVVCGASFKLQSRGRTWLDTCGGFLWPPEQARVTKKSPALRASAASAVR